MAKRAEAERLERDHWNLGPTCRISQNHFLQMVNQHQHTKFFVPTYRETGAGEHWYLFVWESIRQILTVHDSLPESEAHHRRMARAISRMLVRYSDLVPSRAL